MGKQATIRLRRRHKRIFARARGTLSELVESEARLTPEQARSFFDIASTSEVFVEEDEGDDEEQSQRMHVMRAKT